MIRSISLKFIAFVLAACFLVCAVASLFGCAIVGLAGLYDRTPEELFVESSDISGAYLTMLQQLYPVRYLLIAMAAVSLLLFAAFFVYLCCVAGRAPGSSAVRASGLNRLPLDLYTALLSALGSLTAILSVELIEWGYQGRLKNSTMIIGVSGTTVLSLLILAFFFALAAQLKTRGGFWWKNTLIIRFIILINRCIRYIFKAVVHFLSLLPVTWQLLLPSGSLMCVLILICYAVVAGDRDLAYLLFPILLILFLLIGYNGYAFGILLKGIKKMNSGNLSDQISTRFLIGAFRDFAAHLNSLSESAMLAAEKQVKAERMKTELITNVSHDIKTPLTSIINYADLLRNPQSQQDKEQYLDVLSRQSLRLKRLIDDLIELSKASSGSLPVEPTTMDASEVITQALGEFSEKLNRVGLTPIFEPPDKPVTIFADGRLVWRVLSNLLSNAVKYALPGTRVYIDLCPYKDCVHLSVKNISAQQLDITASELLERFVRGDSSRNTEGSGLGLNIAKSLMELQQGQFHLTVDGDLFKVTLIFPVTSPDL